VQSGQIVGATQQIKAVLQNGYWETSNGIVTLAGSMLPVLVALSKTAKLSLLSLMRYNEGPHGKVQTDGTAVCSAMDIEQFGQFPINLINGDNCSGFKLPLTAATAPSSHTPAETIPAPAAADIPASSLSFR
jgi:hypothetical protein